MFDIVFDEALKIKPLTIDPAGTPVPIASFSPLRRAYQCVPHGSIDGFIPVSRSLASVNLQSKIHVTILISHAYLLVFL